MPHRAIERDARTVHRTRASRYAPVIAGCIALSTACYDPTAYDGALAAPNLLTVQPAETSIPADGATVTAVVLQVPEQARADRRSVTLVTTAGTLAETGKGEATVTVDATGTVRLSLIAPAAPGPALLRAGVAGVSGLARTVEITFIPALASTLELEPERFTLKAGLTEEVKVTAFLRRSPGRPSSGACVQFRATTASGEAIGRFSISPPSDANGVVVVRFSAGTTAYRGPITIIATTPGTSGTDLEARTTVELASP